MAQLDKMGVSAEVLAPAAASDGHLTSSEMLVIHTREPVMTFWPALQALLEIPNPLTIPEEGPEHQIIENPDKSDSTWDDSLTVTRDAGGHFKSAHYFLRGEGGGRGAWVEVTNSGFRAWTDTITD